MNGSIIKNISANSSSILNESILNNAQNATTIIPEIDLSWFYSASAQSAAAIVGLMGAFITTKVLNQSVFIKQLKKEIGETETRIKYVADEIFRKEEWVNEIDLETDNKLVDEFLDRILSMPIIDPLDPPSLESLYEVARNRTEYQDINKEILGKKYGADYLEKIKKYKANQKAIESGYISPVAPSISSPLNLEPIKRKWDKYDDYKGVINTKKGELTYLNELLLYKKDQVESNKVFINLRDHIINLVIFSMVGVFVPLFMLRLDYNIMFKLRFVTFFLILAGWLHIAIKLYRETQTLGD